MGTYNSSTHLLLKGKSSTSNFLCIAHYVARSHEENVTTINQAFSISSLCGFAISLQVDRIGFLGISESNRVTEFRYLSQLKKLMSKNMSVVKNLLIG